MSTILGCGPLAAVDGPRPLRARYGLLQAAEKQGLEVRLIPNEPGPQRWLNGVESMLAPPHDGAIHTPFYDGTGDNTKTDGELHDNPKAWPVTVYVADTCAAFIVASDLDEFRAKLLEKLTVVEGSNAAEAWFTGTGAPVDAATITDANTDILNGGVALSLIQALAALEGAIAQEKIAGVIHMSPLAAVILGGSGHIIRPDPKGGDLDVLRTVVGTLVVPDQGYVGGTTPEGESAASATQEWMFATGAIDIRREQPVVLPETIAAALDRGLGATLGSPNAVTLRAERNYLITYDNTIQAAVLANRS
jgi:hypothetical protein